MPTGNWYSNYRTSKTVFAPQGKRVILNLLFRRTIYWSTLYLPAWSIGPDCYKEVYDIVRPYGKKVAVIGGKTAMSIAVPELKKVLDGTDLELTDPIWFGGEASYENAAMLEAMPEVRNADMIFGIGGGRALDTAKCAAGHLKKPIFAFPTLASNCASCTTLCVMYYPDGAMRDLYYPSRCAVHTFMNTTIIANSPAEYMWAGIGDSLAKEFESELAARNDLASFKIQHAPLMGTAIARCCTGPFLSTVPKPWSRSATMWTATSWSRWF